MLDAKRIFLLPIISESEPAGKLIRTPGRVDAAAINPIKASGVSRLSAKGFRIGFLDIVELRIANVPITHRMMKNISFPSDSADSPLFCAETSMILINKPSISSFLIR